MPARRPKELFSNIYAPISQVTYLFQLLQKINAVNDDQNSGGDGHPADIGFTRGERPRRAAERERGEQRHKNQMDGFQRHFSASGCRTENRASRKSSARTARRQKTR